MRLLAIAAAAVLTAAPAPPPEADPAGDMPLYVPRDWGPPKADCPDTAATLARREGGRLEPRALGDLPGADHYAAVYRRIDGCEAPVVVSYGIGGRSPAQYLQERR